MLTDTVRRACADAGVGAEARPHMVNGVFKPTIVFRDAVNTTCEIYPQPYSTTCHELLHLERYFQEWVPFMEVRGMRGIHPETGEVVIEDGRQVGSFDVNLYALVLAAVMADLLAVLA